MIMSIRKQFDCVLAGNCNFSSRTFKLIFLVLVFVVFGLFMLQSSINQPNSQCQDWIHDRLRYALWPLDYTPQGNVTNMRKLYREYLKILETPTITCEKRVRYGNVKDGGWTLCDERPFSIKPPCLVHSWGINWDFSFDDSIGSDGGCNVYAFDPSMNTESFDRSERVHFYNFGIKGTSINLMSEWELRTYEDTLQYLGQQRKTIDFLKFDVEGAEWAPLSSASLQNDILHQVRQMAMEVHIFRDITEKELLRNVNTLKRLRQIGYEIYQTERNPCGLRIVHRNYILGYAETCCHNVYFVNTKFRKPSS